MRKDETIKKHLEVLKILKEVVKYNPKLSMSKFMKDHKLSNNAAHALTKGKIIINTGGKGYGKNYIWNTIEPNIKMAEEWLNRMQENANKSRERKTSCFTDKDFDDLLTVEEKIISLRKKGFTYSEIVDELNVKHWKVHRVCTEKVKENDLMTAKNLIKSQLPDSKIPNIPEASQLKQKSIVILWGLINIKF